MPRLQLPMIQSFKSPGSDREIQLRLYNNAYVFTTTVGTQTDPEVFFVNGKPARAVQPFRVVPKKPKETVVQMTELELALAGHSFPVYNTQSVAYLAAWPSAPLEEQQYQEGAAQEPAQLEQQEISEASVSAEPERQSQETQTDMEFALDDEGTDTASASEDSNTE